MSLITRRLVLEFAPLASADQVERCIEEAFADFNETRVRHYVPILVERSARLELAKLLDCKSPAPPHTASSPRRAPCIPPQ